MRKLLMLLCAVGMTAAVAATATAQTPPNRADFKNAAKYCKALRTFSGSPEAFAEAVRTVVGSHKVTTKNAYGKCVASQARNNADDRSQALKNAAKECKAEQAQSDADFMAAHNGNTFAQQYGTNHNGSNAYGQCVKQHAQANRAAAAAENKDELNAAKQCKAEKADPNFATEDGHNGQSFNDFYGGNGHNAFGKCVSTKARAMHESQQGTTSSS